MCECAYVSIMCAYAPPAHTHTHTAQLASLQQHGQAVGALQAALTTALDHDNDGAVLAVFATLQKGAAARIARFSGALPMAASVGMPGPSSTIRQAFDTLHLLFRI